MIERTQPIVKGVDKKGELIWGFIPMPRWQMEMFRVKYYGDFMAHWIKRHFFEHTGYEPEHDMPSMEIRSWKAKEKPKERSGD